MSQAAQKCAKWERFETVRKAPFVFLRKYFRVPGGFPPVKIFARKAGPILRDARIHFRLEVFPKTAAASATREDSGGHGERFS
jgi:hypothetical protein